MIVPRIGVPVDPAAWAAVAIGAATIAWSARIQAFCRRNERRAVIALAVLAGLLSWGYVAFYLRGGPRIIDATSYYLSARSLAEGHVTFPVADPETSVLGRFLVRSEDASGVRAAVVFPPGYPLVLSIGFLLGAPMLVGPLLAALLVLATYALAIEVTRGSRDLEGVPLTSAALSTACAALRYHTSDTMSHGLAALLFTLAVTCLLRARRLTEEPSQPRGWRSLLSATSHGNALFAGLFGGWLFATRPASGLAFALTTIAIFASGASKQDGKGAAPTPYGAAGPTSYGPGGPTSYGPQRRGLRPLRSGHSEAERSSASAERTPSSQWRPLRAFFVQRAKMIFVVALGAVPLVIVYLVHLRLATGSWLVSTHAAHYAQNDGPAGCFRYGFGEGIGCYGEHADFVRANLPRGFGFVPAVKTTARRLWMHLVDPANAEPLALLVPAGAWLAWSRPGVRAIAIATALLMAAYVPFYFDGNYPGGGARLFADALPFEHVLLAIAAILISARRTKKARSAPYEEGAPAPYEEGAAPPDHAEVDSTSKIPLETKAIRASETGLATGPIGRSGAGMVGVVLVAFGVRAGFDHAMLRDRDGGAPLFSEAEARAQGASSGVLFVDSDAAFNLGFDPDAHRKGTLEVVRSQGEALDRLAWIDRGSPSFSGRSRFVSDPFGGRGHVEVTPYPLGEVPSLPLAIDAGSLWPPRAQEGSAFALPSFAGGTCARATRLLRAFSTGERGLVRVGVPASLARGRSLTVTLLLGPATSGEVQSEGEASVEIGVVADGTGLVRSVFEIPKAGAPSCVRLPIAVIPSSARVVDVTLMPMWRGPADPEMQPLVALDRIDVGGTGP